MTPLPRALLHRLPKVDLHLHLDGAVRVATLLELARTHGVPLPASTPEQLAPHVQVPKGCASLKQFLETFEVFYPVLRFPDAMERIAREVCEDVARENVVYFETRFAPLLQETPQFPLEAVLESVLEGLRQGMQATGVRAQAILCCYRPMSGQSSVRTVELALRYRDRGVCGVDLAGDEALHPIGAHAEALELARKNDLPITIHAGEAGGPENVREAVLTHGARRIGHGTRSALDAQLMDELAKRGVTLEVCLTSNVQTGAVRRIEEHPLRTFFARGVPVALSTDDPGVSAITLTDELSLASAHFDFGLPEMERVTRTAARVSFQPNGERARLDARIAETYRSISREFR